MTRKRNLKQNHTHSEQENENSSESEKEHISKPKDEYPKSKKGRKTLINNPLIIGIAVIVSSLLLTFLTSISYSIFFSKLTENRARNAPEDIGILNWRPARENIIRKYASSICTIERKDFREITTEQFEKNYRYIKPVIITFPNGAYNWTIPERWTVSSLNREYGDWVVGSGNSLDIVRRGGNGEVHTSFSEFVGQLIRQTDIIGEPFYVFDRNFYNASSLPETLKPPPYFKIVDGVDDSIFFLGASSSGVTFHKHADSWNGVIFGYKRWFLYPKERTPPGGVPAGFTTLDWFETVYPKLKDAEKPLECVQKPGEILYLPESFYHGTINLGDTVAIGIQKKRAVTEVEKLMYQDTDYVGQMREKLSEEERKKLFQKRLDLHIKMFKMVPSSAEICARLCDAYRDLEDLDNALIFINKAIELDPYFVNAYLEKGKMLNEKNMIDEAEESLKKALEINPRLWDVYATYGDLLFRVDKLPEALNIYRKGYELRPDMLPFLLQIREVYKRLGDRESFMQVDHEIEIKSQRQRH